MNIRSRQLSSVVSWVLTLGWISLYPPVASAQSSSPTAIVQETSSPVQYTGSWLHGDTLRHWIGGTAATGAATNTAATLSFTGTGVSWIGFRGPQAGIARVLLDGALVATIDLFAVTEEVGAPVFAATALADTAHTLTIEVTGERSTASIGTLVVVDAFEITGGAAGIVDMTAPTATVTSLQAGAIVPTGLILRATAKDDFAVAGIRFRVDDADISSEQNTAPYWTSWDTTSLAEGLHTLSVLARDTAGNIGVTDLAVTVDRTPPAVEMTSPVADTALSGTVTIAANVFDNIGVDRVSFIANGVTLGHDATPPYQLDWETTMIPDGPYTLEVSAQDRAGGLNRAAVTVTVSNATMRIEENDPGITYSGAWAHGNTHRAWSAVTASVSTQTMYAAQATLPFNGTGVIWIGFRGPQAGIANVYLDGVKIATLDLYDPVEHVQAPVFELRQLAPGSHTLTVEATGSWNSMSTDPFVVVDSFIIFQR